MKDVPLNLAAHLASRTTTLAWAWLVTRRDGVRLGFTDHDRPLAVDGVTCDPENGLDPTAMQTGPDLAVGGGEVSGALRSGALSGEGLRDLDLELGLWDGAEVAIWRVNWQAPGEAMLLRRAQIGEVSRSGARFTAELRSLSHQLEGTRGRVFSATCDADLGEARCGIDLTDPRYAGSALVSATVSRAELRVTGLSGFAEGWFTGGLVRVTSGEAEGFASEISAHQRDASSADDTLVFWQEPPVALTIGTTLSLTAGCDKRLATCREKFANLLNFQGFPHMPGNDFVLSYPVRNSGENDGSALRV